MTYQEYIKDTFLEHHAAMGMDIEEAEDLFNETPFQQIEKWLKRIGYDLNEYNS
jgi:hypothetical protein